MIGVVVDQVRNTPVDYIMFRELNKLSRKVDCFLFVNQVHALPMKNNFSILQSVEAMSHAGTLIATDITTCQIVNKSLTASKKLFYMWDLEWNKIESFNHNKLFPIMHNKEIDLVVRGSKHFDIVSKLFRKPKATVCNWRAEELLKVI